MADVHEKVQDTVQASTQDKPQSTVQGPTQDTVQDLLTNDGTSTQTDLVDPKHTARTLRSDDSSSAKTKLNSQETVQETAQITTQNILFDHGISTPPELGASKYPSEFRPSEYSWVIHTKSNGSETKDEDHEPVGSDERAELLAAAKKNKEDICKMAKELIKGTFVLRDNAQLEILGQVAREVATSMREARKAVYESDGRNFEHMQRIGKLEVLHRAIQGQLNGAPATNLALTSHPVTTFPASQAIHAESLVPKDGKVVPQNVAPPINLATKPRYSQDGQVLYQKMHEDGRIWYSHRGATDRFGEADLGDAYRYQHELEIKMTELEAKVDSLTFNTSMGFQKFMKEMVTEKLEKQFGAMVDEKVEAESENTQDTMVYVNRKLEKQGKRLDLVWDRAFSLEKLFLYSRRRWYKTIFGFLIIVLLWGITVYLCSNRFDQIELVVAHLIEWARANVAEHQRLHANQQARQ